MIENEEEEEKKISINTEGREGERVIEKKERREGKEE